MADPVVRVRVVTVGGASINQTLRGATREQRRQGREQVRGAQQDSRAIVRSAQQRARDEVQAGANALRAYRRSVAERVRGEREVARAATAAQRQVARETAASARARERIERQTARNIAREQSMAAREAMRSYRRTVAERMRGERQAASLGRGRRRMLAGAAVGGAVAAGGAARDLFNTAEGALGIQDPLELLRTFGDLQRQLIRTGSEAGKSEEQIAGMMRRVLEISRAEQIDPSELVGGLAVAQESFSALDDFLSILPEIARAAEGSGSSVEDLIQTAGALRNIFGLTRDEMRNLFADMYEQGKQGALGMRAQAEALPAFYSAFGARTGRRGRAGALEGGAFAQVLARGTGLPAEQAGEVATIGERTIVTLADPRVATRLARAGVQIREGGRGRRAGRGALLNMEQIQANLAARANVLERPGMMERIFGRRVEAHRGIQALITAHRADPTLMAQLQRPDTAAGRRGLDVAAQRIQQSAAGQMRRQQIERVVGTFERAPDLIGTLADNSNWLSQLKTEFPLLTTAISGLTTVISGIGVGAFASRFLGTGAIFGAANAAGTAASTAASTAAAGGAVGILAPLAAVLAGGGALLGAAGLGGYGLSQVGRAGHNAALRGGVAGDAPGSANARAAPAVAAMRQQAAARATTAQAHVRPEPMPLDGREAARLLQEHMRAAIQQTPIRVEVTESGTVRTPMQRRQTSPAR